jgi:hypothetical protein
MILTMVVLVAIAIIFNFTVKTVSRGMIFLGGWIFAVL